MNINELYFVWNKKDKSKYALYLLLRHALTSFPAANFDQFKYVGGVFLRDKLFLRTAAVLLQRCK